MSKRTLCFISLFFSALIALYADVKIINPEPGTWANRQVLVLSVPDGEEAFYSLSGSDPLSTGFAYDGPVLLDVAGPVELRVISMKGNDVKTDTTVVYTVTVSSPGNSDAASFVNSVTAQGIVDYTAGASVSIPSSMEYSMGGQPESYLQGSPVSYAANCILSRCIPCTVTDGSAKWRFIIRTFPSKSGTYTQRSVPFKIDDWSTITFTNNKLIYKIDDSFWSPMKVPVKLDRSVKHTVFWQSVAVQAGNPVEYFELPPEPELFCSESKTGAVTAVLRGDADYRIGIKSDDTTVLFEVAGIDTFSGDETEGTLAAGIYYDSVYQGTLPIRYDIDRRAPPAPVITSSAASLYSRKTVKLQIDGEPGAELYIAVSSPVPVTEGMLRSDSGTAFDAAAADNFVFSPSGRVSLEPDLESAVYYKVCAYSIDEKGSKGATASYGVIIDQYNYYLDASADSSMADGSYMHPFTVFDQCIDALKYTRYAHITINGTVNMPSGQSVLSSNCVLDGRNDARLVFGPDSSFVVRSASLTISNCVLERSDGTGSGDSNVPLLKLEHSVLSMDGCETTVTFDKNGTAITADTSVITITGSGITTKATVYSSCISSVGTKVKISNARISTVAATAVNFSSQDGDFELRSSTCKIVGTYGRAAELFGTHSRITGNTFSAELGAGRKVGNAVYTDAKNVSVEYSDNILNGF
jgi:hypothetical protein